MRIVIQRVRKARLVEEGRVKAKIGRGYLMFVGIGKGDGMGDFKVAADKIAKLRLFQKEGKVHDFQLNVKDAGGEILALPNYTLYGDLSKGNRPYFGSAESTERAKNLYRCFLGELGQRVGEGVVVKSGTFGRFMQASAEFDGPATIILEIKDGRLVS